MKYGKQTLLIQEKTMAIGIIFALLIGLLILTALIAGVVVLVVCLTRKKKQTSDEQKTEGS